MKQGDLLFVYGTLRPGERASLQGNPRVLHMGEDIINGLMYHLGGFPGVVIDNIEPFNETEPLIYGDVFMLRDDTIVQQLDAYEGYPSLYNRVEVPTAGGRTVWVYTYNYDVSNREPMRFADWRVSRNGNIQQPDVPMMG